MDINLGVFDFLLGGNGQRKDRTVLYALHFYTGNGGPFSGVMELPVHHKIGLPFLEQTAPLNNITTSNHVILA
jgi:hypothetical protein